MKLLNKILIGIVSLVVVALLILIVGDLYIKKTYGIDLLSTTKQLKKLNEPVDEAKVCTNPFTEEDMVDVQTEVNKSIEEMVKYEDGSYVVDFEALSNMKYIIKLTDKQVGALANTVIQQETDGVVQLQENVTVKIELKQIDFKDIQKNSDCFINTVVKLDLTEAKSKMTSFPYTWLRGSVPDYLYISSTIKHVKGSEPYKYTISHDSLLINNLNKDDTSEFFKTLDVVLKIGSAEHLNLKIGEKVMSALVGSDTEKGLAYSLKSYGSKDYGFIVDTKNNEDCYVVDRVK